MNALLPLGDQGALVYFADEAEALRFAAVVQRDRRAWLVDVVPAYGSVAVFFDLERIRFREVAEALRRLDVDAADGADTPARCHRIPCCYELQLDLARVAEATR